MNKKIWLYAGIAGLFFGAAAYMFFNRTSNSQLLKYVPTDASVVLKINVPEIARVVSEDQKQLKELKLLNSDSAWNENQLLRLCYKLMKDPEGSGIDFSSDAYFFSQTLMRGDVQGFVLKLNDESTFASYVKKSSPIGTESGEYEKVNFCEYNTGLYISWLDDIALITNQITEEKSYFADILKQKNPGAKGNTIAKELQEQNGILSGYASLKAIKNELLGESDNVYSSIFAEVGNAVLKDGVFAMFNIEADKGIANAEIWLTAADKKKNKEIPFFGEPESNLIKLPVFYKYTPQSQIYVALDLKKTFEFLKKESPEFKATIEKDDNIKTFLDAITGNFNLGVTINEKMLQAMMSEEAIDFTTGETASVVVLHAGITDKFTALKNKYAEYLIEIDPGIYRLGMGLFIRIYSDHISFSNNLEAVKALSSEEGFNKNQISKDFQNIAKKSALTAVSDNTFFDEAYKDKPRTLQDLLSYSMGKQTINTDNGKLKWKVELQKKNEHFLLSMIKMINKLYEYNLEEEKNNLDLRASQEIEY